MIYKIGLVGNNNASAIFADCPNCTVVYNVDNGSDAIEMQVKTNADVVVTELVVPSLDGFELISELKSLPQIPKIIVLTDLKSETFITRAYALGIDNYFVKPADKMQILRCVSNQSQIKTAKPNVDGDEKESGKILNERISNIFISVGIPPHIKGYQYLREGIKLAVNEPTIINSITKCLYPEIAKKYETTPSKVERAIRHAIEVACGRGKIENINALFGIKVYSSKDKPTNGEFIALLADKMLLECGK